MPRPSPTPMARMSRDGLRAANLEHTAAAEALYVSTRTIGRYVAGDVVPPGAALQWLAAAVAPHDGALAAQLARAGGAMPSQPAAVAPAGSKTPVALQVPMSRLVEIVVCAAAEAIDAPPRTARAAIAAALVAARDLGLTSDTIIAALVPRR